MDIKEINSQRYSRRSRFHEQVFKKAKESLNEDGDELTKENLRIAINYIKYRERTSSGQRINNLFYGNSIKFYRYEYAKAANKVINRRLKQKIEKF